MLNTCQLYYTSCIIFCLLIASRIHKKMARTKQTPRNPNVNRPKTVVGSDVQPTERRPNPKPASNRTPVKGGKQPRKHLSWKLL